MNTIEKEKVIRAIVASCIQSYASGFSDLHINETDDEIVVLGSNYYSALVQSIDKSLKKILEIISIHIANFDSPASRDIEKNPIVERFVNTSKEELLFSREFWNQVCKTPDGYDIVMDEYHKNILNLSSVFTTL